VLPMIFLLTGCAGIQDFEYRVANKWRSYWAWEAHEDAAFPDGVAKSYREGWKKGYYDRLTGGTGQPPAVPPKEFWAPSYQTAEGAAIIELWYSGFRDGTLAAEHSPYWNEFPIWASPPPGPGYVLPVEAVVPAAVGVHQPAIEKAVKPLTPNAPESGEAWEELLPPKPPLPKQSTDDALGTQTWPSHGSFSQVPAPETSSQNVAQPASSTSHRLFAGPKEPHKAEQTTRAATSLPERPAAHQPAVEEAVALDNLHSPMAVEGWSELMPPKAASPVPKERHTQATTSNAWTASSASEPPRAYIDLAPLLASVAASRPQQQSETITPSTEGEHQVSSWHAEPDRQPVQWTEPSQSSAVTKLPPTK